MSSRIIYPLQRSGNLLFLCASGLLFNPLMSGLLGMDFLSQAGVTIDIPKAEIILKPFAIGDCVMVE